jgi:tetratricopeptide (TPR) repeat protein/opacity protein-like surface antigen
VEKQKERKVKALKALCAVAVLLLFGVRGSEGVGLTGNGGYDAALFQADYIQDLTEFSSGFVNPALLYRVNQLRLELGIYRWNFLAEGSMGFQELSFLYPHRLNHTFGISVIGTGTSLRRAIVDNLGSIGPDSLNSIASYDDIWTVLHYSWRVLPWFVVGTNVKFRYERQFEDNGDLGVGGDVGMYFNPLDHYRYGDVGLSLNLQDVIPTQWFGTTNAQMGMTRLRFGARYSGFNDRFVAAVEGVEDNIFAGIWQGSMSDLSDLVGAAKDSALSAAKKMALRGSFHVKWEFVPQVWLKCGWANNNIPYIGFHLNFIYPLPEMINYANFDCHIGYSVAESERGVTFMNKLSTDFGPTREQRESKRMYDLLILAPMDAYNEAMRLYLAGKYWEASYAFGKVLSLYPNFYLNDKASFYMGNCYRFLQMNGIAREVYKSALEEYTTSDMRPKYLYGLENIDYRENKYEDALKNHAFITNLYGESEIRPDADYLAGEIHFLRKNYASAEQLLSKLKPGDPSYLYAQYTLSIINVENKRNEAAIANLQNVIKDTTQDPAGQLLQDGANTKLGHLYFEQVELRKAVESYKRVAEGSSYGDEALLGTAWAWIKVNQPAVSMQTVDRLLASHPESPLVPEGYLLRGYSQMLQKNYGEAITALEKCVELTKGAFVTDADVTSKEQGFRTYEKGFEPTAAKIRKNALRKPTDKTIEERGAFKGDYDKFAKESRDYFNYQLLGKSHKRFFMRKEEIVQDADYALAKATSVMKGRKQNEVLEKGKKEEDNINKEIDKLKQQLRQEKKK